MTSNVSAKSQTIRRIWSNSGGSAVRQSTHCWNDYRIGEDDPLWKSKVASGLGANNDYTCYERRYVSMEPMYCRVNRYGNSGALFSWTLVQGIDPTWCVIPNLVEDSTVINDAYTKFNQRVSNFIAPVKGLTFLGELMESVRMVKGRTKRILTDVIKYRKALDREVTRARRNLGNKTMLRDVVKRASESWLEYAFGWVPLADDIEKACEVLRGNKSMHRKVSAKADKLSVLGPPFTAESTTSGVPYNDYATFSRSVKQTSHTFSRVVGVIDLRLVRDREPPSISSDLGLSLREFVPSLWELTPYSFLVDYFTNVGDLLGGVFAEKRSLVWISQTTKVLGRSEYTSRIVSLYKGPYDYAQVMSPMEMPYVVILARKLRRFTPAHTIPSFQLSYPNLGSLKYLNMVALLTSRIKV